MKGDPGLRSTVLRLNSLPAPKLTSKREKRSIMVRAQPSYRTLPSKQVPFGF